MRKVRLMALLTPILAVLLVSGCGKDDSPSATGGGPATMPGALVGTWSYQTVTINSTPVIPITQAFDGVGSVSATMALGSDFSYLYEERDIVGTVTWSESGTVSVSGASYTRTVNMENGSPISPDYDSGTWSMTGPDLTTTVNDPPDTIVVTYVRP